MADSPIKVGGAYVENEDHTPNPTDMVAQYNTEGVGAHGRIQEVAPIFEVDRVKTAAEVQAALDPENTNVPESRVLLPSPVTDNDVAKENLLKAAEARLDEGVVIGGPTPAEREAELDGDEGTLAAVEADRRNSAANSTGNRGSGEHEGTVASDAGHDDTKKVGSGRTLTKKTASSGKSDGAKEKDGGADKA